MSVLGDTVQERSEENGALQVPKIVPLLSWQHVHDEQVRVMRNDCIHPSEA